MKTISVGVQNLCVPCGCACRYCLLQSNRCAEDGVDYVRGKRFAARFLDWDGKKDLEVAPYYYTGYCAESPTLGETVAFNLEAGFPGARFLQGNGIALRNPEETNAFVRRIRDWGIENIDATFFGTEAYHDHFAARSGDFRFMLRFAESAAKHGLTCTITVPVTKENISMLDELLATLSQAVGLNRLHTFLPDYRGRGWVLEDVRLTEDDLERLPSAVLEALNLKRYKAEHDWLANPLPEQTRRQIIITLRCDNIDMLESMSCDEAVAYVEALDDAYYRALPPIAELAEMYGEPESKRLYQLRDLYWKWSKRYIVENGLKLYDVTDERFCASIRS